MYAMTIVIYSLKIGGFAHRRAVHSGQAEVSAVGEVRLQPGKDSPEIVVPDSEGIRGEP